MTYESKDQSPNTDPYADIEQDLRQSLALLSSLSIYKVYKEIVSDNEKRQCPIITKLMLRCV